MDVQPIIHIVGDYGPKGDLAWSEVVQQFLLHAPNGTHIIETPVAKFNMRQAAFVAYQLGVRVPVGQGSRVFILVNVDDRSHTIAPIADGAGAPLFLGGLRTNGVRILGPGSGIFAVAQALGDLHSFAQIPLVSHNGEPGQFRSRDMYPSIVGALAHKKQFDVVAADRAIIPGLPQCIVYVDGYGNLKTSVKASALAGQTYVTVAIDGCLSQMLPVTSGLFAVAPGTLHCYPGSSGDPEDPLLEIGIRSGSAAEHFNFPAPGTVITLTEVSLAPSLQGGQ